MSQIMDIDGSLYEGGGQILRMALCFSVLCKKPVRIYNIRGGRKKPGLMAQHTKSIELLRDISNARVTGLQIGSMEIVFHPGDIGAGKFIAHVQTAGSISLLMQAVLPVAIFGSGSITLDLKGGTNVDMAPQVDFMTEIFRPNLEKFGATFDFDLLRRGYFPKGGGHCIVHINSVRSLRPVTLIDVGTIDRCFGWSFVSGAVPMRVAKDMADGAKNVLKRISRDEIKIDEYKESVDMAVDNCSGIILGIETSTGMVMGGATLGNRQRDSFRTGEEAANEIKSAFELRACVDRHVQDMVVVLMALANGQSKLRTEPLTLHTQTAIFVAELMTKAKFAVHEQEDGSFIIQCDGIGITNQYHQN
ncbi:RNA 3'-terminal phosphate cyclase [Topomyia yanbarensis]|uniref:RNA 3'-terminal phosphate cyclase n=1 Tax=Topomyia yanbarensis TaxID=2498891 RepID=UPI00273AD4E0|nr:RNA 3'-terminal phosphate cyclase [Topomyia yanbarensis]XP_058833930.1 RNA 3'-terminal phosphate cyclase [Topomyia yanbarensis]